LALDKISLAKILLIKISPLANMYIYYISPMYHLPIYPSPIYPSKVSCQMKLASLFLRPGAYPKESYKHCFTIICNCKYLFIYL
jgi:hypothetical protein